jgi:hypothetical protein
MESGDPLTRYSCVLDACLGLTDSSDCSYFLHYSVFNRAGFLPGHCGLLLLAGRFALSTLVLYGPCQMH